MPSVVTLRPSTIADAELIHAWRSEPSTSVYQPTLPLSLAEIRARLAARSVATASPGTVERQQWTIEAAEGPVGWISLSFTAEDRRHRKGSVGYTIGEQFRGRGYGTAALGALLPIAFGRDRFGLERLEAIAAVNNGASRRVLEANGFRFEGVLRGLLIINGVRVDHAIYGLLRTDWEETETP
ncbi:MAG TPA: GNAT family protein [Thermomicrobiales bacterium]|jgi:RimJ/RimL family protein N-acetyltransferase